MTGYEPIDVGVCKKCFRKFDKCNMCYYRLMDDEIIYCNGENHLCEVCYNTYESR